MIKIRYPIDNFMNLFQFDLFNNNSSFTAHVAASMILLYARIYFA